jgi:hypothetical protein
MTFFRKLLATSFSGVPGAAGLEVAMRDDAILFAFGLAF